MEGLVIADKPEDRSPAEKESPPHKILVTGADGYIGSVLCPILLERGFEVTGLDTGYYRSARLFHDGRDRPPILTRDIRRIRSRDLQGFDAIIHLAELSNDPLCDLDESMTYHVNHLGTVALAQAAEAAGVRRFIYASSCSVYGAGGDETKTEESAVNPQTAYARCKVAVERDLSALASDSFCPTYLRFATAFGASPHMRFDVVLNNLSGLAWTTGRISMTSDGTLWRPLVHICDIAEAIVATLKAPREKVFNEAMNVGDDEHNYRVVDITAAVAVAFPNCAIEFGRNNGDNRSYRVSFGKIRKHLPGFTCRWDAQRGAQELRNVFEHIHMTRETFNAPPFTRLRQLKHLCETGQLDEKLYWRTHAVP